MDGYKLTYYEKACKLTVHPHESSKSLLKAQRERGHPRIFENVLEKNGNNKREELPSFVARNEFSKIRYFA